MNALAALLPATAVLAFAALAFIVAHRSPRLALAAGVVVLCLVPVWVGARLGFNGNLFLPAAVLVALALAAALLPVRELRASPVDAVLVLLVVLAASSFLTSDATLALSFLVTPFTYFVAGYAFGRIGAARLGVQYVYRVVAVIFTVVAVLAIIEFLSGWNPFVLLRIDNSQFTEWGDIQERGGHARAEGAFGHSIALGASLALAIPLTLATTFRFGLRLCMVGLMVIATVFTFSRIGIVCAVIGILLSALLMRDALLPRHRALLLGGAAVVGLALMPLVLAVFTEAGEEASDSAAYRGDLLPLLSRANLVGFSDIVHRSPTGDLAFGSFRSVDSQVVLTGLTTGSLALVIVGVALLGAIVLCLRRRANAATIAVVAQIPALLTVALITQYSVVLWLVVGIAATSQVAARTIAVPAPLPSRLPVPTA